MSTQVCQQRIMRLAHMGCQPQTMLPVLYWHKSDGSSAMICAVPIYICASLMKTSGHKSECIVLVRYGRRERTCS